MQHEVSIRQGCSTWAVFACAGQLQGLRCLKSNGGAVGNTDAFTSHGAAVGTFL